MPARTQLVTAPSIKVNGADTPASDDAAIVDLHVSSTSGMPSQLTIRFVDPTFALLDGPRYVIGSTLEVSFPDDTGSMVKVFEGEVVSVGVDQRADQYDGCELTVTALDVSHRLSKATKVRTFQKQKYSDLVSKIAQEA